MPLRSAQGDAADDAGEADDDSALVRRALRGLAAKVDALGEQTAAGFMELKQMVGSISETVDAMAQRDALLLVSGTLPQLRIKGAVVHTLGELCTLLSVTDAAAVRMAVEGQCAAVLRTPALPVRAVLDALCARAQLTAAQPAATLDPLLQRNALLLKQAQAAAFPPGDGGACDWHAVEAAAERALEFFIAALDVAREVDVQLRQAKGLCVLAARMRDHAMLPGAIAAAALTDGDLRGGTLAFALFTALHVGEPLCELEFDGISSRLAASTLYVDLVESKISAMQGACTLGVAHWLMRS